VLSKTSRHISGELVFDMINAVLPRKQHYPDNWQVNDGTKQPA
jgi:hypothetical protein